MSLLDFRTTAWCLSQDAVGRQRLVVSGVADQDNQAFLFQQQTGLVIGHTLYFRYNNAFAVMSIKLQTILHAET